ncbi:CdaR family transcriptional regulator [Alkalihalobacillus sp. R86527]|uniref:CdaR family transcriptional regulator n=1 Tax=Alkalihalobacillus sp. R86527 TaxID=3093863 RepID=UPI00366D83DC
MITHQLAEPILIKLSEFLDYDMNVMDEHGVIVASSDSARLDQIHEGAIQVIAMKEPLVISTTNSERYAGVKPGVNLPIEFSNKVVGVVGVTGDPEELYKFANVIKITVEVMIEQVYVNNQLQYQNKLMENWVFDLIHPEHFNRKTVEEHGKQLFKFDFEEDVAMLLISFPTLHKHKGWAMTERIMRINDAKQEALNTIKQLLPTLRFSSFIDDSTCVVGIHCIGAEIEEERSLAARLHKHFEEQELPMRIGIGNRGHGADRYRDSYFQAKQSLELMDKFQSEDEVVHISDWKLIRLLANTPDSLRSEMLASYFSEDASMNEEALHTLEVLFETNLNMKATAERLHIHRNTLQYRLDRIHDQIGLDPRTFQDAATLMMLLVFKKLA